MPPSLPTAGGTPSADRVLSVDERAGPVLALAEARSGLGLTPPPGGPGAAVVATGVFDPAAVLVAPRRRPRTSPPGRAAGSRPVRA